MSTYYNNAYLDAKVESASPLHLVHLAYECAIDSVGEAREHLANGMILERSQAITRATNVLMELKGSLNHQAAPAMSGQLAALYTYMIGCLREANFKQIAAPLTQVAELLQSLGDSWSKLAAAESESVPQSGMSRGPESDWVPPMESVSYHSAAYSF